MSAQRSHYRTAMFNKMFWLFTIVVVGPAVLVGLITYGIRYDQFQDGAARYLHDVAVMRARQLDTLNQEDLIVVDLLTDNAAAQQIIQSGMQDQHAIEVMRTRVRSFQLNHAAFIRDNDGNEISVGRNPKPVALRSVDSVLNPIMGPTGGRGVRALVTEDGRLITQSTAPIVIDGVIVGQLDLYWNSGAVSGTLERGMALYKTAEVSVWLEPQQDGTRQQLWPPRMDPSLFGRTSVSRADHPVIANPKLPERDQITKFTDDDWIVRFAGTAQTYNGWTVLVTVHESEIIGNLAGSFFLIFGTAIGLLFVAVWFLTRSYGQRLLLLGDMLAEASEISSDAPQQNQSPEKSRSIWRKEDELTDAIKSVDQLIRNLETKNRDLETKLRQRGFELAKAQGELSESASTERVMQMTSVLSHEINQPLGNISILVEDWLDDDEIAQIDGLADDLRAINDMVEQVRTISRTVRSLGSKNAEIEMGPVALRGVVEQAYTITVPTLISHDVRFSFDVPATLPPIAANKGALLQVFSNLIQNACLAMDGKGERAILVQTQSGPGHVIVDVVDSGQGIPESILPEIFKPGVSSRLDAGGSGLGLPIVRRIVESLGGRVSIAKTGHGGTTVRLTFAVWQD